MVANPIGADKNGVDQDAKSTAGSENDEFDSTQEVDESTTPPHNLLSSAGVLLGKLRRLANVTQQEVADRMETTQPAVARLEKGLSLPNLTTIERYAAALSYRGIVILRYENTGKQNCPTYVGEIDLQSDTYRTVSVEKSDLMSALTDWRKQRDLTQSFVAKAMNTTQPMVARLESAVSPANVRTLERYAAAVGLKLELVFEPLP